MSDTRSAVRPLGLEKGQYVVHAESSSTVDVLPEHASATQSFARMTRNAMLPLLFGLACFGGPAVPGVRRVFSDAATSRSAVADYAWLLVIDAFQFTEEVANPDEVRTLNTLLHLPATSGLELDLFE
jgi:hypothetical protein